MARKRRSVRLWPSPRAKKKRRRGARSHHNAELVGLGLLASGVFLAAVLWFGLSGGPVAHAAKVTLGWAAYLAPLVSVPLGGLIVTRSELVSLRPFRLGLSVALIGLMTALGHGHGGYVGRGLESLLALGIGSAGATIVGVLLALVGALFLTGASLGAILRRSGHVVRHAHSRIPRRAPSVRDVSSGSRRNRSVTDDPQPSFAAPPPVDVAHDYPDLVSSPAPLLVYDGADAEDEITLDDTQTSLFDVHEAPRPEYELPDRSLLRRSNPSTGPNAEANQRTADALVQCLANFGVDATMVAMVSGPRVTRYELQLAAGTKVGKVANLKDDLSYALATTEIRILAPIPGKQAVGVEVPNLSPNLVTLGDIYDDLPASASPRRGVARQGHLRRRRLDRPREDAAPPDRRHHRLG